MPAARTWEKTPRSPPRGSRAQGPQGLHAAGSQGPSLPGFCRNGIRVYFLPLILQMCGQCSRLFSGAVSKLFKTTGTHLSTNSCSPKQASFKPTRRKDLCELAAAERAVFSRSQTRSKTEGTNSLRAANSGLSLRRPRPQKVRRSSVVSQGQKCSQIGLTPQCAVSDRTDVCELESFSRSVPGARAAGASSLTLKAICASVSLSLPPHSCRQNCLPPKEEHRLLQSGRDFCGTRPGPLFKIN